MHISNAAEPALRRFPPNRNRMLHQLTGALTALREYQRLPSSDRPLFREALHGPAATGPSPVAAMDAAFDWLCLAQDRSATLDGGVARHFSVRRGWGASYPETTGYIVSTFLTEGASSTRTDLTERARRMLDWLASIQMRSGAFQGGMVEQAPTVPVTFNTGQILLGLSSGVRAFGEQYRPYLRAAGDWLIGCQDADGAWRRYESPFRMPGPKAYYTHVAWGLLEAERVEPGRGYADAALRNVRWAVGRQLENGWVANCCLTDASRPLTHTIGYFLRGVVEAFQYSGDATLLAAAQRTADALVRVQRPDGALPGRLDADWRAVRSSTCLTGNVQIAHSWLLLYSTLGSFVYLRAAVAALEYVRRTMRVTGSPEIRGGIRGSFPLWGDYAPFEYVNWAPKFFIDAQALALRLTLSPGTDVQSG